MGDGHVDAALPPPALHVVDQGGLADADVLQLLLRHTRDQYADESALLAHLDDDDKRLAAAVGKHGGVNARVDLHEGRRQLVVLQARAWRGAPHCIWRPSLQ